MSIDIALKSYTNPEYSVSHWIKNNIYTIVFTKGSMSYAYSCVSLEQNKLMLFPHNLKDHNEFSLIFNTDIFDEYDEKICKMRNDLNFMNTFCFGKETSFYYTSLIEMLRKIKTMNGDFSEYSGISITDKEMKFLIKFTLVFDTDSGEIEIREEYQYYSSDGKCDVRALDFEYFKAHFMFTCGASKIEKSLTNMLLSDATVVQMVNL